MQEDIQEAKELFFQNRPIEHRTVRPEILESWKRSRAFGVNEKKADKRVLSKDQLRRRIDKSRDLYQIAVPVMESLYTFTTGSGFLTVISDEKGYVLKAIGDKGIMELARKNMLVEGCNRSERKLARMPSAPLWKPASQFRFLARSTTIPPIPIGSAPARLSSIRTPKPLVCFALSAQMKRFPSTRWEWRRRRRRPSHGS